jgi:lipoprotein-releasing system permease protein
MLNNFVLTIAFRYFSAKKNERFVSIISAFSLLGVMIGVAALIVVMSVMKGFHREFTRNIIGLNGDINISSISKSIPNYDEVKQNLLTKDYIIKIIPSATGQALAIGTRMNTGVLVKGIDIEDLKYKKVLLQNVMGGTFSNFYGKTAIAVGSELAYTLGIKVGSKLKLIAPNIISTFIGSMPRSKEFNVVAIFSSGMYDYDSATILMPLIAAQTFLSFNDNINLIEISTKYPDKAEVLAKDIQHILSDDLRATSWQRSQLQFLNALAVERVAMFTILSLIIVVAAFNIISSLFMLVKDKTKDIAILRTIGASHKHIMLIFICNGMFIGSIGTIAGIILGSSFASNIDVIRKYLEQITDTKIFDEVVYFLYNLPSEVHLEDVCLVGIFSITLCFFATIYPAYKASRLDPVEALRYE